MQAHLVTQFGHIRVDFAHPLISLARHHRKPGGWEYKARSSHDQENVTVDDQLLGMAPYVIWQSLAEPNNAGTQDPLAILALGGRNPEDLFGRGRPGEPSTPSA